VLPRTGSNMAAHHMQHSVRFITIPPWEAGPRGLGAHGLHLRLSPVRRVASKPVPPRFQYGQRRC